MATGYSPLQFVPYLDSIAKEKHPPDRLEPENCYVRVKLHAAQAFFKSGWLENPGFLTLFCESKFASEPSVQSLHRVETLSRNVPCQIGLSIDLTDFLPVSTTGKLEVQLKYVVTRTSPIKDLLTHLNQVDDVTPVLSLLSPHAEVSLKASKIVGQLFSFLTKESTQTEILTFKTHLNWSEIQTGFYAVIGSATNEDGVKLLRMDANDRLVEEFSRQPPTQCSYAVFKVERLDRRGDEAARGEAWWEVLRTGREDILDEVSFSKSLNQDQQGQLRERWHRTVSQVRLLTKQQKSCLLKEQDEMIQVATQQVLEQLSPVTRLESVGHEQLPERWQTLLKVRSLPELKHVAQAYQSVLAQSHQALAAMDATEMH
jgi:hypothetical protein